MLGKLFGFMKTKPKKEDVAALIAQEAKEAIDQAFLRAELPFHTSPHPFQHDSMEVPQEEYIQVSLDLTKSGMENFMVFTIASFEDEESFMHFKRIVNALQKDCDTLRHDHVATILNLFANYQKFTKALLSDCFDPAVPHILNSFLADTTYDYMADVITIMDDPTPRQGSIKTDIMKAKIELANIKPYQELIAHLKGRIAYTPKQLLDFIVKFNQLNRIFTEILVQLNEEMR